jgi:hypothetical protein
MKTLFGGIYQAFSAVGAAVLAALCLFWFFGLPSHAQTPVIGNVQVVVSGAAETNHVLKATPGYLVTLAVDITTVNGWVMLFDATVAPADGAVTPRWCETITGNGTLGSVKINFPTPLRFPASGIVAVYSSTGCFTKTGSNAAFFAQVQ